MARKQKWRCDFICESELWPHEPAGVQWNEREREEEEMEDEETGPDNIKLWASEDKDTAMNCECACAPLPRLSTDRAVKIGLH